MVSTLKVNNNTKDKSSRMKMNKLEMHPTNNLDFNKLIQIYPKVVYNFLSESLLPKQPVGHVIKSGNAKSVNINKHLLLKVYMDKLVK